MSKLVNRLQHLHIDNSRLECAVAVILPDQVSRDSPGFGHHTKCQSGFRVFATPGFGFLCKTLQNACRHFDQRLYLKLLPFFSLVKSYITWSMEWVQLSLPLCLKDYDYLSQTIKQWSFRKSILKLQLAVGAAVMLFQVWNVMTLRPMNGGWLLQ